MVRKGKLLSGRILGLEMGKARTLMEMMVLRATVLEIASGIARCSGRDWLGPRSRSGCSRHMASIMGSGVTDLAFPVELFEVVAHHMEYMLRDIHIAFGE